MRNVCNRPPRSRGFTLLELIVSMAVIGILVSLLLPAVQSSREASRRVHCLNNLRQIVLAMSNREAAVGSYPSLFMADDCTGDALSADEVSISPLTAILPFVDQSSLYEQLTLCGELNSPGEDPAQSAKNPLALTTHIPLFACPSDRVPQAGNSYRASQGTSPQGHETDAVGDSDEEQARAGALMGVGGTPARLISDGLSQTIFVSERLVGDADREHYTPRRDIHIVETDASVIVRPADAARRCQLPIGVVPEHRSFAGSTWFYAGSSYTWFNHITTPNGPLPDCSQGNGWIGLGSVAARSNHPGGVNVALGDGAGRFVADTIDLSLWRALGTRAGHEVISHDW